MRPTLRPLDAVKMLGEIGAYGVNFHDNDLVPIDASPQERDRIVAEFRRACEEHNIVVPMATVNLFYDAVFRDGAFTANDKSVRAYALQKTMRAMDLGADSARKFSFCGAGVKASKRMLVAVLMRQLNDLEKRLITSANIPWTRIMITSLRWRPSRTNRVLISTCRPPALISDLSQRSSGPRW